MALIFNTSASEASNSESLAITDLTGSASPGGWGYSTNPSVADVLTCIATITKPDTTTLLPSLDPSYIVVANVFPTLPNNSSLSVDVLATALGYGSTLQTGIYKIVTSGTGNDGAAFTFSDTVYLLADNALRCCIENILLSVNLAECNNCLSKDSIAFQANMGIFYLNMASIAFNRTVPDLNKAAKALVRASQICSQCSDCNC